MKCTFKFNTILSLIKLLLVIMIYILASYIKPWFNVIIICYNIPLELNIIVMLFISCFFMIEYEKYVNKYENKLLAIIYYILFIVCLYVICICYRQAFGTIINVVDNIFYFNNTVQIKIKYTLQYKLRFYILFAQHVIDSEAKSDMAQSLYDFSPFTYYGAFFMFFVIITFYIYFLLYNWRNLSKSVLSFILFSINIGQLILYLFAISALFNMYYHNTFHPIYLEDISVFSQYRYLILSITSIFFIIIYLIVKLSRYNLASSSFSVIAFPYFKEEIRKILYTWNDGFIGNLCIYIIDLLITSLWFRVCFFIIHFILFYGVRLFSTGLLFYCTFYHGDFCKILYIVPIMFFVWILSFFNYYFFYFQKGCADYICSLISATSDIKKSFMRLIKVEPSNISFILTEQGIIKGYSDLDMYHLTKEWYIQAQVSSYFYLYLRITSYLNYLILLLQIIIWFYISQTFFPLLRESILSNLPSILRSIGKYAVRPYATEARRVLPPHQKALGVLTEGVHKDSHPALVDHAVKNPDNEKEILYEGQPTHGKGSPQNPSHVLHPSKDVEGKARPQHYIPPRKVVYVPEHFFEPKPIEGSTSFLNDSTVKVNLAKNAPREENT